MLAHGLYKTIRMFFLVNSLILIAMENIIYNIRHSFCKMQRRKPAQNLLQAPILKKNTPNKWFWEDPHAR